MKQFRFLEWQVYIEAQELFILVLRIVRKLPKEFRFEIGSQINRSALSVILNIAEGSGKTSDKELNRYLDMALGSLYQTLACSDTLKKAKLISEIEFSEIEYKIVSIAKQIGGFKKKIDV